VCGLLPRGAFVVRSHLGAALCTFLVLAGCDGSGSSAHPSGAHAVTYAPNGVQRLVRGRLATGAKFSVSGERYSYLGQTYFGLKATVEEQSTASRVGNGSSSTTSTKPGEHGVSVIRMQTGCTGSHAYALAFGFLRAPRDTVLAQGHEATTVLHHVPIPASLHAGGVLVYSLLPSTPSDVIVRAPNGKTVSDESYTGLPTEHCPNREHGASAIGSVG
jgi:hypothetical protein